jgi:phosphatidylserine decarboxylase
MKNKSMEDHITYWDRAQKKECIEQVYGEAPLKLLYGHAGGRFLVQHFLSRSLISKLYGKYNNSLLSQRKISPFIQKFKIPMDEFEKSNYKNFNDFFTRRFRPGKRPIVREAEKMAAFAEGRYLAFNPLDNNQGLVVKGIVLSAENLLQNKKIADAFRGGPAFIARLCPTDYHRFHFPDQGSVEAQYQVAGALHSVNPFALQKKGDILFTNERHVSIVNTKNFGRLAVIEVGALMVGLIIQTHKNKSFERGQEKGYFRFGASCIVVLGQTGCWSPDEDLLEQTAQGKETLIRLGEGIAHI